MRDNLLPFYHSDFSEEEHNAIADLPSSSYFTEGLHNDHFEEAVCKYLDVRNAIGVISHSGALELVLASLGIGEGD